MLAVSMARNVKLQRPPLLHSTLNQISLWFHLNGARPREQLCPQHGFDA